MGTKTFVTTISCLAFLILMSFSLAACSASDEGGPSDPSVDGDTITDGDGGGEALEETLNDLGVDTSDRDPVPLGFHPLGRRTTTLAPIHEMMVVGPQMGESKLNILDDGLQNFANLFAETGSGLKTDGLKAATAGDIDADGYDEAVFVLLGQDKTFTVWIYDDAKAGFGLLMEGAEVPWPSSDTTPNDIDLAMGDFDGDSKQDLILAAGGDGVKQDDEGEDYTVYSAFFAVLKIKDGELLTLGRETFEAKSLRVAAGNLDNSLADEFVLSVRGKKDVNSFYVYAMSDAGIDEIETGNVQYEADNGDLMNAAFSDVAIGDIDADGLGEILFGGGTESGDQPQPLPIYPYLLLALDDANHDFREIAGDIVVSTGRLPNSPRINDAFIEVVDLQGDYKPEIVVNEFVFKNFADSESPWEVLDKIPNEALYVPNLHQQNFSRSYDTLAVGDFTGDNREDIAILTFMARDILIYGLDMGGTFGKLEHIQTDGNMVMWPCLQALNTDQDSSVVRYDGDYKYVFTEPIVLAALAAPPCRENVGQNLSGCATYYGNTKSETITHENSLTFRASFIVGTSIEDRTFTQSAFELEAEFSMAVSAKFTNSRTEEVSVVFSSGSLEDSVVFLTVPYDVYTYTIVSHEKEELIGQTTTVSTPRKPVILIAERDFYNRTVGPDYLQIDDEVFTHTPQELSSYPSRADKDALLDKFGGMQTPEYSVGQGSGGTDLSINVAEEWGAGMEMEIGFDLTVKTTVGGVTLGGSFGMSSSFGIMMSSGESTTYGGTVGSIDAEHYADEQFVFGLFTYPYFHSKGQQFHVIQYFVEKL